MNTEYSVLSLVVFVCIGCSDGKKEKKSLTLDDCPVIAVQVDIDGGKLTHCDLSLVKDTFNIPLSSLLSSFEMIRLENTEEALTAADGRITVGENFIGVKSFKTKAYKLYDKKGKYLSTLSAPGQGPDEYFIDVYDSYLDEINRKAYLLSFRASKILVFDFDGKPLRHIPLSYLAHKGRFVIHPERNTLTMMVLPFENTPSALIWEQDFDGNVLQEIPVTDQFVISPSTYDNEVWESLNTSDLDYSLLSWMPKADTLYHYQKESNHLQPMLTMSFKEEDIRHNYIELPNHYLIWLITQTTWQSEKPRLPKVLIDKETLRGCYVDFKLNMLGNIEAPSDISFSRGYFTAIMEPYILKEQLEKAISNPEKLTPVMLEKIKAMNDSITDDDNCFVFIGKLKDRLVE